MKNKLKNILLVALAFFPLSALIAQNAGVNMLVLNSGLVPIGGNGVLQATISATIGTSGQSTPIAAGKINLQVTVPSTLLISATQNNLPAGWIVRNNDGAVINICNSAATIAVNTVVDLLIDLQGVSATSGSPTLSGQLSFRSNCNAPGSLSGDNPSDNSGQAGFLVASTVPVKLTNFNVALVNCTPVLNWATENETNSGRFEIERAVKNSSQWDIAGSVGAKVNSTVKQQYAFTDNANPVTDGKVMYRVKIIDKDGRYEYSNVLPVFITCKEAIVKAYPNPVQNGNLYVNVAGATTKAEATLHAASGQIVLQKTISNGITPFNVSGFADGVYILKVDFETGESNKIKVLIQK